MIETVTMYRVRCDRCGVSAQEDSEYYAWADEDQAREDAANADWREIAGKDYCAGCWEWNEDTDEPEVKPQAAPNQPGD